MWSGPEQYSENYSQKGPAKFEIFQKPYASIVLKWTVDTIQMNTIWFGLGVNFCNMNVEHIQCITDTSLKKPYHWLQVSSREAILEKPGHPSSLTCCIHIASRRDGNSQLLVEPRIHASTTRASAGLLEWQYASKVTIVHMHCNQAK